MNGVELVKNYGENDLLRNSFFDLANRVFGLPFQKYYEAGSWGEEYMPFSLADEGKIIANVFFFLSRTASQKNEPIILLRCFLTDFCLTGKIK
ncbi:hypothetical protein [Domibacillus robiginosus]|uniref:hypothetical protein n=1 Tax=Domibacillus robiginosus TaxID=1071054 RepID=UPI0012E06D43|nr:hypothetical protein [Domibacillus robiginosus]